MVSKVRSVLLLLAATTFFAMGAAAAASAETVPLPSGAASASSQSYQLNSTSCPAAGDCVAVGDYTDSSGAQQGLIATESDGSWSASEANLSSLSPGSNPHAVLDWVSCASAGNCVAVGNYTDGSGAQQGLIATESGGSWSASEANISNITTDSSPDVSLNAVSCPSAGNCVAVGYYKNTATYGLGLILTDTDGTWTASQAAPSLGTYASDPPGSELAYLGTVSCSSAGNCAAGGTYWDTSNHEQALLLNDSNGSWTTTTASFSSLSVGTSPNADIQSVSCPSAGNCSAAGYYQDSSGVYQGLLDTEQGGTWAPVVEAPLPANGGTANGQFDLYINSISCASAGNCTAVGSYDAGSTSSYTVQGLAITETNGTWATGAEASVPADAASDPQASLASVSCVTAGNCIADGGYEGSNGDNEALIAQQSGGNWSTVGLDQQTAINSSDSSWYSDGGYWGATACSPGGYCLAAGYSQNHTTTNDVGFLYDAPGATATPSASVSGTTATVSWTAPSDDGGLPVTGYTVTANDQTNAGRGGQSVTTNGTTTTATISGLSPDDTYTFTVSATSLLGTGIAATSASVAVPPSKAQLPVPPSKAQLPVPPSKAQLLVSLSSLLAPKGHASRLKSLRRTHSYTFTYKPLESGKVIVRWYQITGHGKHRHKHLVASGSASTHGTTTVKVKVRLTALGRRLVKSGHRLKLTAYVRFSGDGTSVTRTHTFTLH